MPSSMEKIIATVETGDATLIAAHVRLHGEEVAWARRSSSATSRRPRARRVLCVGERGEDKSESGSSLTQAQLGLGSNQISQGTIRNLRKNEIFISFVYNYKYYK